MTGVDPLVDPAEVASIVERTIGGGVQNVAPIAGGNVPQSATLKP